MADVFLDIIRDHTYLSAFLGESLLVVAAQICDFMINGVMHIGF